MKRNPGDRFVQCPKCHTRFPIAAPKKQSRFKRFVPLLSYFSGVLVTIVIVVLAIWIFG